MDFSLRTYAPDPQSKAARRRRRNVAIGLTLFCLFYGLIFAFFAPYFVAMFAVPLAFVALMVVWALPEVQNPPTRTLQFLMFGFIISLAVWPNDLAVALPGLPWITISRIFLFPMALIFLVCLSVSERFRKELRTTLDSSKAITVLILVFVAVQFVSILLSTEPSYSFSYFVINQISLTVVFFIAAYVYSQPGRAIFYTRIAWVITVFACLIGLVEWKMGKVPWQGHIPAFLKIDDPAVRMSLNGITRSGVGIHRVQSIFTHPTTFSEYLALVVPFIVDFAVKPNRFIVRMAAAATVLLMAFVVYLTNSRTGSIGFLVAFLAYGFFWSLEQRRTSKSGVLGSAVFFGYPIGAIVFVIATMFIGRIRNVVWGGSETRDSNSGRQTQWHMGIPIIEHNPFGHGIGTSGDVLQYREASGLLTVDSYFLTQLLDVGVIGFIIYYAGWVVSIASTSRTAMKLGQKDPELSLLIPVTCTLTNFLIIKTVFSQTDNHPLVYTILGMGVALIFRAKIAMGATVRTPKSVGGGLTYKALASA